jgi:hypothetical protein
MAVAVLPAHGRVDGGVAGAVGLSAPAQPPALSGLAAERSTPAPLSFAQERFWRWRRQETEGLVCSVLAVFRLAGPLDTLALCRALAVVFERHEALRTTFREIDGRAVQVVHPAAMPALPLLDVEALPPAVREAEALRLARADGCIPFDLEAGPLVRLRLFRCAAEEHLLACVVHHVAFDGWSEAIFITELTAQYGAFRQHAPSPLPPLPVQVQDHARWQRHPAQEGRIEAQRSFWRERLRGAMPLDLAAIQPRVGAARRSGYAGSAPVEISAELSQAVQGLGAGARATPFMTLLAAFQTVLSRVSGQSDVTILSFFAHRAQPGVARLIGNFFTVLPLRVEVDGRKGFRTLLAQVRGATLAAYENADVLYEEILEEGSAAGEDPASAFRIFFTLQSLPAARPADGYGLTVSRVPLDTGRIGQDLTFLLSPAGGSLTGRLRYDTGILDAALVADLRDAFLQILRHAALDPDRPLDDLLTGDLAPSRSWPRGST